MSPGCTHIVEMCFGKVGGGTILNPRSWGMSTSGGQGIGCNGVTGKVCRTSNPSYRRSKRIVSTNRQRSSKLPVHKASPFVPDKVSPCHMSCLLKSATGTSSSPEIYSGPDNRDGVYACDSGDDTPGRVVLDEGSCNLNHKQVSSISQEFREGNGTFCR